MAGNETNATTMIDLEVGDKIRAIDHLGDVPPVCGEVIQVSRFYVFVWYDPADRRRLGLADKADMYYRGSGWRYPDGEDRWRLQLIRKCEWCKCEISEPGQAHPVLWHAAERGRPVWKCADSDDCIKRQDGSDLMLSLAPLADIWKFPVATLEAAP